MPRPLTLRAFLARPSRLEWETELREGWEGPDGSSMSTDTILGVRIGRTSTSYAFVDLPANRHDWYYRLGRRYKLPDEWRAHSDRVYRDLCIALCRDRLGRWSLRFALAKARAHVRYAALRVGAAFAWTRKAKLRQGAWHS